jgi:hypothetical protein
MPRERLGPTGLKMSQLKTKQKPSNPFGGAKRGGGEFPSMEATNFFDPKSLGMNPGRGSSLPRRKAAPLEMEFNSVPGSDRAQKRVPPKKRLGMKGADKDPFEVY